MPIYLTGIENSFGSPYCIRNYNLVEIPSTDLIAFEKIAADERVLIVVNPSIATRTLPLPPTSQDSWFDVMTQQQTNVSASLSLGACDFKVLRRELD
ncbi:MAG: hypothetical protein EOO50_04175 [Flavobacterium sp.]|uniref:alpha-glucosidase C-terminal domain-containing protein n=1 Tax=Flavobacterium sp. TaxID=239 RepID=UPI001200F22C|nr:alpha-glucosidase C-terminal domain-containing protein [Flavobacterium sp.]RZJ67779.1 MAG: hypothetical protein EOO50_04175 [Flavobacterium sp.]